MEPTWERVGAEKFLDQLAALAGELGVKLYLTGGGLRDALLGRTIKDLDFALSAREETLPVLFARRIAGKFFWLDTERRQSRVVARTGESRLTFDFAPFRGDQLEADLALRDFTINAMALDLDAGQRLIDPRGGEEDLRNKIIRRCSPASFDDDPLRLLRAVRLATQLGFEIEAETLQDMTEKAPLLENVAAERIRDELLKILESPGLQKSLTRLHDTGLLEMVNPEELPPVAEGVGAASSVEELVNRLEVVRPDRFQLLACHLARPIEGEMTALALAKLAALAGRGGKGRADAWGRRLKLGRKATRLLSLLSMDTRPVFAKLGDSPSHRAMFRFFRDHEPAGMEMALLAFADGSIPADFWGNVTEYYFTHYDPAAEELLLSGREVMELLGMGEGLAVGRAMEMLREAESNGLVENKEEAWEFLLKNVLTKEASVL